MTTPIRVTHDFRSHRKDTKRSLVQSFKRREPVLGFMMGLVGIMTIICSGAALYGFDLGSLRSHFEAFALR